MAGGPGFYFEGGASYVDVRDAAACHIAAAERGKPGERYLAVGHNLTNRQALEVTDRVLGQRRRYIRLPTQVARAMAIAAEAKARRSGVPPILSRDFFEYSLRPSFYRNDKAVSQLGVSFRPIEDTVRDAVSYFRERGMG
jgi:dihydroflavonol-4-reductase